MSRREAIYNSSKYRKYRCDPLLRRHVAIQKRAFPDEHRLDGGLPSVQTDDLRAMAVDLPYGAQGKERSNQSRGVRSSEKTKQKAHVVLFKPFIRARKTCQIIRGIKKLPGIKDLMRGTPKFTDRDYKQLSITCIRLRPWQVRI